MVLNFIKQYVLFIAAQTGRYKIDVPGLLIDEKA
jgi:hypothetical protein